MLKGAGIGLALALGVLREDVRSAVRSVSRARALTAVLLISLGLGTGANAAVFSVIDALLFRAPGGVVDAERLTSIHTRQYDGSPYGPSSFPDYLSLVASVRSLETVAAIDDQRAGNVRVAEHTQLARVAAVTENFFGVLGMAASAGRLFVGQDAAPTAPSTAILSVALWEAAQRPQLDSLTVSIHGRDHAVVGIAARGFRGLESGRPIDVWIPLSSAWTSRGRGDRYLSLLGRLRARATFEELKSELNRLSENLATEFPTTNRGTQGEPDRPRPFTAKQYSPLPPAAHTQTTLLAAIVAGAVGMLLIAACMNAGTLQLSRGFARRRELAVKMALGATRRQLVFQLLTESVLIAIGAAALGLLFAAWTIEVIPSLFSPDHAAMLDRSLRLSVMLVTLLLATVVGVGFGIAPAFHGTASPAWTALRADAGGISDQHGGRGLRTLLVSSQIALSTVLLLVSGQLTTSLQSVLNADRTPAPENVALVALENPGRFEDPLRGIAFQATLVDILRKKENVHTVGWAATAPLVLHPHDVFRIEAGAAGVVDTVELDINVTSPSFFRAAGIKLIEGRLYDSTDKALTTPVVVVNELLARRYFGPAATGQHLVGTDGERFKIIGVVRAKRLRTLQEVPRPTVYFPVSQRYVPQGNLIVAMTQDAAPLVAQLPDIIRRVDDAAKVTRVVRMDQHLSEAVVIDRLMLTLVSACGSLALLMAVLGVYGVMNDAVHRRTREIGLRVALGAARTQVAKLVYVEAVRLSLIGLTAGMTLALLASRILGSFYSLPAWDVTTLSAPPALLALIVAIAAILPLRRALGVNAAIALNRS